MYDAGLVGPLPGPRPTTGWWRVPVAVLVTLAALALPMTTARADEGTPAPGATPAAGAPGAGQPGAPAKPEKPPVWTGVPGTNAAHDTYGYPWPAAPDCDESSVGSGCVDDGLGFFQGQCTSWVAFRLGQRNGLGFSNWFAGRHWGNATEWSKVAKAAGYVSNKVPAAGAVGWYARGHVSYVEDVNSDGSVVISEMNTDGHNGFVVHTVYPGDSSWPDRFVHLADVVPVDLTAPGRPSDLTASPAPRGVAVSWSAPSDDVGVTGYRVLRNGVPLAETATASYVDRQASPGQSFTYSVVAHDLAGNVSAPSVTVVDPGVAATPRQQRPFVPGSASVIAAGDSSAVCGLLGTPRDSRVGCSLRTLGGWKTVRTGRSVPWGLEHSRTFVAGDEGTVWFCRVLAPGGAQAPAATACLPLDLATQSWGFDRVSDTQSQPAYATWVPGAVDPTRCGVATDRASCSVLRDRGWRTRTAAPTVRVGDPLSRAFVGTEHGTAFCRTVESHATCTGLDARHLRWGRTDRSREVLPHGRWVPRPAGTALCLPAGCRTLPTKG